MPSGRLPFSCHSTCLPCWPVQTVLAFIALNCAMLCCACCAVLCRAVLCCAVLCCAVLCCAVPCSTAVLCCAAPCCAAPCCAVPCCAALCCAVLCCAVLCCAVLCCAVLSCGMPCCWLFRRSYLLPHCTDTLTAQSLAHSFTASTSWLSFYNTSTKVCDANTEAAACRMQCGVHSAVHCLQLFAPGEPLRGLPAAVLD